MMQLYVFEFSPPMVGFTSFFNTFRLGTAWSKKLEPGMRVLLMDKPHHIVFGIAEVISVKVGTLGELAAAHAAFNHNQLGVEGAADRLIAGSIKRYGPHKCSIDKKFTVVYLKRVYETIPERASYDEQ